MFEKLYVDGLPVTALDTGDFSAVRRILNKRGYVMGYIRTVVGADTVTTFDGGEAETLLYLAALSSGDMQWLRAWLTHWRSLGPGTVEVIGGDDGTQYSKPDEKTEAEIEICQLVSKLADPIREASTEIGFS